MKAPALGPRGEGWVAAQIALFIAIGVAGAASLVSPGGAPPMVALIPGAMICALGLLIAGRGALDLGSNLTPFPRPRAVVTLVETGIYRYVRHPIYGGLVLAGVGWSIATVSGPALILTVGLAVLFDVKARREEAWLAERLPSYAAYRARTRKFVPAVY